MLDLTSKYNKLNKIAKGEVSPNFNLIDVGGNMSSLNQFKGKYVYIDIWATWCLPCIKEFPFLKELEKEFKNIQFISICKNSSFDQWEKMVKNKELKGMQLFAPDENISFFNKFMVKSIPRFILIDDEGKVIDAYAIRPSNAEIKTIFRNLK